MKKVIIILIILIIGLGVVVGYLYWKYMQEGKDIFNLGTENINEKKEEKPIQIFNGTDRPIAVMIDNHKDAMPHAGLNKAYIVYEIIVEGGESRLMALFKGQDLANIGPVRSSRHYFLDYALENDAIYVHYGWSPQAERDIKTLAVHNINGISESANDFWRSKEKAAPHNVLTSTKAMLSIAENKKYRTTSDEKSVLNYVTDEVDLGKTKEEIASESTDTNNTLENTEVATAKTAKTISIPYSPSNKVKWEYNEESKTYSRYSKGIKETEWFDKTDVTAKNIIIEFIKNSKLQDNEDKDRQDLDTTGTKKGYYITNGKAIEILCSKSSRKEKTTYTDKDGNEIKVNDGNTFIQICPIDANVEME